MANSGKEVYHHVPVNVSGSNEVKYVRFDINSGVINVRYDV